MNKSGDYSFKNESMKIETELGRKYVVVWSGRREWDVECNSDTTEIDLISSLKRDKKDNIELWNRLSREAKDNVYNLAQKQLIEYYLSN